MDEIIIKEYVDSEIMENVRYIQVKHSYETGIVTISRDKETYEISSSTPNLVYGSDREECMYFVPEKLTDEEILRIDNKLQQVIKNMPSGSYINLAFIKYGSFDKYLKFLKKGKELSRKEWIKSNKSILYNKGYTNEIPKEQLEKWGMEGPQYMVVLPHLQMKEGNTLKEYQLTLDDIMADDWYMVNARYDLK